jgi:hypothetical protein
MMTAAAAGVFGVTACVTACVTAPDRTERLAAPTPRSAEHDSIAAWWASLPAPNCRWAVGQVAYVQPLERVVGADVTLRKQDVTHYTRTNGNGQFRMPIDSGTWHIRVEVDGRLVASLDLPLLGDSIVPRLMLTVQRPSGATLLTDSGRCARPPGHVDTLRSVPPRGGTR